MHTPYVHEPFASKQFGLWSACSLIVCEIKQPSTSLVFACDQAGCHGNKDQLTL